MRGDDIDELVDVLTFMENIGAEDVAVARLKSTLREIATIATMATEE